MLIIRTSFAFYLTDEMKYNEKNGEKEKGGGEDGMWRKWKTGNAKSKIVKNLFSKKDDIYTKYYARI